MSRVRCLYCDVENDAVLSAGYCENCGKKLPPASQAHGRREPIYHQHGVTSLSPRDYAPPQPASAWLYTAALVNLLGCGALIVVGPLLLPRERIKSEYIPHLLLIGVAVLAVFAALAWWARRQPASAVVVAVLAYLGLSVVDALLVPGLAALGIPVKIVILALLIQAFRVSRKPRRLVV